jgi:hypothetical protein
MLTYIQVQRIPIEGSFCCILLPSDLFLLFQWQFGYLKLVERSVFLGFGCNDVEEAALENRTIGIVVCFHGMIGILELDKSVTFAFSIALFH